MTEHRPPRRRRRRHRRAEGGGPLATGPEQPSRAQQAAWNWRTFPVFFAFVVGGFLILLIAPEPNTALYTVLFVLFLGGTAYGLAHLFTRWLVTRRRGRS